MCKRGLVLLLLVALWLAGPASAGLIGWWTFEDPANLGADSSGKGNNGTVAGDATFSPDASRGSGALLLDGTDDFINVGLGKNNMLADWTSNLTIAAWIKPDDLQRQWNCFFGHTTQNNGVKFELMSGNFRFTTLGVMDYDLAVSLTTGEWSHVAVTFNEPGNLAIFYANGQETGEVRGGSPAAKATGNYNVGYGGYWEPEQFQGLLDDVRIYDKALTAAQISDLYNDIEPSFAKAEKPSPADGATGVTMPLLQWSPGENAKLHSVFLGTSAELTAADQIAARQPFAMVYVMKGLLPATTYYWRVDEIEADGVTTHTGDVWTFTTAPLTAYNPNPRSGDKWVATDATLTWVPGQAAMSHDMYFGTDKGAVANRDAGTSKGKLTTATYSPEGLNQGATYYWVVDEITSAGTNAGAVWSFTTTTGGGGVKGEYFNGMTATGLPALTRIDPVIDFSWGDPGGPGAPIGVDNFSARWTADLEIAVADTYTFITNTDDGARLWLNDKQIVNQWVDQGTTDAPSKPIALELGIYPLRMEYYENTGGAVARLFWQTPTMARQIIPAGPLQPPVHARALYPASGDVNVPQDVTLMWSAGEKAVQHQVYFGDDANAVANATADSSGIYKGQQALDATSFSPGSLEWNKTYYWRIDEVNDASAESPWKGSVWSFTTADFIVVDDFESYNDEADKGTRIYETWIDGLTNLTTSTVGNWDPPFAEQTIVHSGKQSMPMDYNNINSPYYAEAEREFSPLQNWTVGEVTDLSLWVRGNAAPFVEDPAGTYKISANSIDVWGTADNFRFVYKTLNGDGSISGKVISMTDTTSTWAKAGVMIRESLSADSSYAFMFPTPDGRRAFQDRPLTAANAISAHSATGQVTLPFWVKVERKGNQLTGYYSTDGKNWTTQPSNENTGTDASANPQTIFMTGSVRIGLAVASNNTQGGTCFATFSDVVTSGSVSGQFQVADIGSISPGNDPATLYVAVEDSSGKVAVISNPDTSAVNVLQWTEWKIPLSDLAGVNLAKVKKLVIGVGDRNNPAADGNGRIFIDDIRVVKP